MARSRFRFGACKSVCRDPLFVFRSGEEPAPERFFLFVDSLRALARVDGLIFFGACNPGTAVAENLEPWEGPLIRKGATMTRRVMQEGKLQRVGGYPLN